MFSKDAHIFAPSILSLSLALIPLFFLFFFFLFHWNGILPEYNEKDARTFLLGEINRTPVCEALREKKGAEKENVESSAVFFFFFFVLFLLFFPSILFVPI